VESQSERRGLVLGGLLIFFGLVVLLEAFTDLTAWVWVTILAVAGLGVFAVYLRDRSHWTPLIPAYVMWVIAGLLALIELDVLRGQLIVTYILAAIALPFLVMYLRDRGQWWVLTPVYSLLATGVMVGLIGRGVLNDLLIPSYVMLAAAIPFFVVYARIPGRWWALIPGGVMAVIGLLFLTSEATLQYIGAAVLLIAGIWILVRQFARGKPSDIVRPPEADETAAISPEPDEPAATSPVEPDESAATSPETGEPAAE